MCTTLVGNPYDFFENNDAICITTNGEIRKDGKAVMGAGNAKFARDTFPGIDATLANYLKQYGNRVYYLGSHVYDQKIVKLLTFPTKHSWRDKSSLELIEQSASQIVRVVDRMGLRRIYVPVPGCGNGGLKWSEVKGILDILDDRFIVYSLDEQTFQN